MQYFSKVETSEDILIKYISYLSISIFALFRYAMSRPLSYVRHDFANI